MDFGALLHFAKKKVDETKEQVSGNLLGRAPSSWH